MSIGEAGRPLRIMVTNDDGIDSIGLHRLARAMLPFGEVTVIAPDREFSGAGAAIGTIWEQTPEVHESQVDGIDTSWTVSGPPALCALYARIEAFGPPPDLIVSGINPGANVGRSVYHSGTVGAALTGRNGHIPGIAVSQSVADFGVEGQAWGDVIADLHWDTAATVAAQAVEAMIADPRPAAGVLNINVPDLPLDKLEGWAWTEVGAAPPRAMTTVELVPKPGHKGSYSVKFSYSDSDTTLDSSTDTGAVQNNLVSLTWLSRITAEEPASPTLDQAMDALLSS